MLRYLSSKPFKLTFSHFPKFSTSEYFGPDHQKPLDIPLLDENIFKKLYTKEKRLQEILYDNEIVKNPKKYQAKKLNEKQKIYGVNYSRYLASDLREEIKGIRGKTAYIFKNLSDEKHPNNYRFHDDVDYSVNNENENIIRKLHSLNYLQIKDVGSYGIDFEYIPRSEAEHESLYKESYPQIKNYAAELKPNEILVHNLPLDTHINDLIEFLEKYGKIKDIKIYYCVLNLPAFAKVSFEKNDSVITVLQEVHWKTWKNSLLSIKTSQDGDYEDSWNRTLCVMNIPHDMSEIKLLEILSDYGRVVHYELPKEVQNPNLPTKEELYKYLEENPEYDINGNTKPIMIKIHNHILDKGLVETYYIPKSEEKMEKEDDQRDLDIEKILDNHDATPLKQRFYPREIYHTAEWSQEFLTPTEKLKSNIFSSKYSEIFNSSKLITEHEHSFYPDIQNPLSPEKAPFNFFESQSSKGPISNKQKKAIRESFERKQLINKGYCFVTFASTDQAKIVLLRLNRARESFLLEEPLNATLKEDLEHYELDNEFIFKLLKRMKSRYTEYLNEIKQKGEQCSFQWERDIENSNQYLESQMQKNDVRKTLEDVLEKELFNDGESATIAGLKPSENYDKISIGRQNSLVVTEKDLKRLRELIDGNIDKKIDEWKVKSKTSEALMAEYINPLHFNENQLQNEMETLRLSIEQQAKELYFTQFSKEEQKEVSLYIKRKVEYFSLKNTDPQNQHNIDSLEALKMFNINPDKYYELIEDKAKKWQYLEKEPFNLVFSQEGQSSDRFENSGKTLLGKVEKKQRFIRFVKYLQMLLLGKFDAKSSTIFDQQGIPLDPPEILMKFSKDKSGNEYLPYEEKERVMEYLRPENEDEKIKILKYEEEKIKFWQDMPNEAKIKLVQKLENSLPLQALYEHEVGLQEKMFKPILKPNQTVEELVYKLNKEAELGVEYKAMNEKPHGEVIVKLVKPAYRVNIGKMGEVDIEKLRKIAEKELIKKEGKLHQKEIERRMKEMAEGLERGMGTFDEKSLKKKDAQRAIAMVMKETPFSRAEIEAILKADMRDPDLLRDLQKQFGVETLKEMNRELKPEDLIKYKNNKTGFTHLKKKNHNYYTSKFKKL